MRVVARGDETMSERAYRPISRVPFTVGALVVVTALFGWVLVAVSVLSAGPVHSPWLCPVVLVGLLLLLAILPIAIARVRMRRGLRGWLGRNEDALARLRAGRYAEAADIWDELAHTARWAPAVHVIALHNLAVAWLHVGRPERTLSLMRSVAASGWMKSGVLASSNVSTEVSHALAHAIVGDVESAERHRAIAAHALPESRRGATMLVDAVIGARRGTLGDPPTRDALRLAESTLMPLHVRAIPLLHAFSRALGDGSYRTPGAAPQEDGGGIAPGDLDFLAVKWPELAVYLEARELRGRHS